MATRWWYTQAGTIGGFLADDAKWFYKQSGETIGYIDGERADVERTQFAAREAVSPLQRLEDGLRPWVAFVIMPLFALANAGVALSPSSLGCPVP